MRRTGPAPGRLYAGAGQPVADVPVGAVVRWNCHAHGRPGDDDAVATFLQELFVALSTVLADINAGT
jgi:hypothetical protein